MRIKNLYKRKEPKQKKRRESFLFMFAAVEKTINRREEQAIFY